MPKTVVITGASAGLGRAAAHVFASRGDRVALLARGERGLEGAAEEVRARGGRGGGRGAGRVGLGPIDVLVNNAMVGALSRFVDMAADEFRRITEVTYLGVVNGTRAALKGGSARHGRAGAGRLLAGLPRDPVAVGVLRRQARDPGLSRSPCAASCSTTAPGST